MNVQLIPISSNGANPRQINATGNVSFMEQTGRHLGFSPLIDCHDGHPVAQPEGWPNSNLKDVT